MGARVAVIYYSATGNVHALAQVVAEGAEEAGAEVRLRHVEELASELLISQSQYWGRHRSQVAEAPVATLDDLEWADGFAFGTPDPLRERCRAAEAVHRPGRTALAAGEAGRQSRHGLHLLADNARRPGVDDPRPEQHALSLGSADPPARLHGSRGLCRRRQPVRDVGHDRPYGYWTGRGSAGAIPLPGATARPFRGCDRRRSSSRSLRRQEAPGRELRRRAIVSELEANVIERPRTSP